MKPQNYKERNIAFLKFILLFTITCSLIVMAVFFGMRLPTEENAYLREKMQILESNAHAERQFASKMEDVKVLLDSMDLPNVNVDYMQHIISTELAEIQSKVPAG